MGSGKLDPNQTTTSYEVRSRDRRFGASFQSAHLAQIVELCQRANQVETGGILVGYYTSNQKLAIVTGISDAPADSKRSRTRFLRGVQGLQGWLNRLWNQDRYYLGEWHYHPYAAPAPSPCDLDQMRDIADSKSYSCPEPLLLIVGGNPYDDWTSRVFVFGGKSGLIELVPDDSTISRTRSAA